MDTRELDDLRQKLASNYPTLRDSFAMAALSGLIANELYTNEGIASGDIAEDAYIIADSMIKQREIKS